MKSKLPSVGTTIFSVMTAKANAVGAINLSQGFPGFRPDARLEAFVEEALRAGHHQYAPLAGLPALQQGIAAMAANAYGANIDPATEITVTSGATEALYAASAAFFGPADEVLLFDPAYDCYAPAIALQGATPVRFALQPPDYRPNWDEVRAAIGPQTRGVLFNTPHNPTGTAWTADDLRSLSKIAAHHDLIVISDEVYQHLVFDGRRHESVLLYPELAARSVMVGSFGKSLHVTGWKIGYAIAPPAYTTELRKVHQYLTFSTATPLQYAIARYLETVPDYHSNLGEFFQTKRDLFANALKNSRFNVLPCQGTYFLVADYSAIAPDMPDTEFAVWLTETHGVGCIPLSVFYANGTDRHVVRFCFAKEDTTLHQAAERLCKI